MGSGDVYKRQVSLLRSGISEGITHSPGGAIGQVANRINRLPSGAGGDKDVQGKFEGVWSVNGLKPGRSLASIQWLEGFENLLHRDQSPSPLVSAGEHPGF